MPIINRDKSTIFGLKAQLAELESNLRALQEKGQLTEGDRALLDLITAQQAINLDDAVTTDRLASDISDLQSDTLAASVTAIREYVLGALQLGGPSCAVESLIVNNNKITLNHKPHPGITGIMNYSTVRIIIDGQARDLALTETTDPYRFTIDPQGMDINGYTVKVQYLYHHDPRELNALIGEMILNGLTLNAPSES